MIIATGGSGIERVDVSDPANPTSAGFYDARSYSYGVAVHGHYAYVANSYDGLRVLNVQDPGAIEEIGSLATFRGSDVVIDDAIACVTDSWDNPALRILDTSTPAAPSSLAVQSRLWIRQVNRAAHVSQIGTILSTTS